MRPNHITFCLAAAAALAAGTLPAQPVLRPAPSGRGMSEVQLSFPREQGMNAPAAPVSVIVVDYGQPHLRGRVLHTDSLVPYDRPWRLGANAATTLRTDVDLMLGGVPLPKGKYVLFALPARTGWKLVVQKSTERSPLPYDGAHDVARIDLRTRMRADPVESLTMWLIPSLDSGPARGELRIAWGTVELSTDWSVK